MFGLSFLYILFFVAGFAPCSASFSGFLRMFPHKRDVSTVKQQNMKMLDLNEDQIFQIQTSKKISSPLCNLVNYGFRASFDCSLCCHQCHCYCNLIFLANLSIHCCSLAAWQPGTLGVFLRPNQTKLRSEFSHVAQNKIWVHIAEHFKFVHAHFLTKSHEMWQKHSMIIQTVWGFFNIWLHF